MLVQRSAVGLAEVAELGNLECAFHRAARGRAGRAVIERCRANLDDELAALRDEILAGSVPVGRMTSFRIHDPKPRLIHAPCFRERVLHHALMAVVGPVLDRTLVFDSYACREGKGTLAAVQRCQHFARRHPWHGQIDIRAYFASIEHERLLALLRRRLKDRGVLALLERIIRAHEASRGKGLPIGALTSQHLANFYLASLDRLLLEQCRVGGMVRYMDDIVWWCESREQVRAVAARTVAHAADALLLEVKAPTVVGRSRHGLAFCGYRVLPGAVLLSRRRRRRYAACRRRWEGTYGRGEIDAATLQAGYGAAWAMTMHADAAGWRRAQLQRVPLAPALAEL